MCYQGLAFVYNKRKERNKGAEFCKEALKLVPKVGPPKAVHMHLLVMLGDAMEGQGEWASARQSDEHAMAMWDAIGTGHKSASSVISAWRREGIQLMRDGKPTLAVIGSMRHAPEFYKNSLQERGISFMRLDQLLVAMDTIKLWAEACFLAADNEDDLWYWYV